MTDTARLGLLRHSEKVISPMIRGIEHIGITVSDLKLAEQFFIGALDAPVLCRIVPPTDAKKCIPGKEMAPLVPDEQLSQAVP